MPALTYNEQLQRIIRKYHTSEPGRFRMVDVARHAIENGEWEPTKEDIIVLLKKHLSQAARLVHHRDPQGRSVRTYYAAKVEEEGEKLTLWDSMDTAEPSHMEISFRQRFQGMVGRGLQYKTDLDSYNDNYNPGPKIPCILDLTNSVLEAEAAKGLPGSDTAECNEESEDDNS